MKYTAPSNGGGGLTFANSGGNTLWAGGTPAATGTITLTVQVIDTTNVSNTASQTYPDSIGSGPSGAHNASLKGQYTCLIEGYKDSSHARTANIATFIADGAGHLTNGVWDNNGRMNSAETNGTLSGTYVIGADNNGVASITSVVPGIGSVATQWAVALSNPAVPAVGMRMAEIDAGGINEHAIGKCYLATPAAFAASTLSGSSFVFLLTGEDNDGNPKAALGRFSAAGGNITAGFLDQVNAGNSTPNSSSFTGTYTTPNSASGRMTMAVGSQGNGANLILYIVDANRAFMLNADTGGAEAGEVRKQLQTSYSAASMNGPFVSYSQGFRFSNGSSTPSATASAVFQGTGSSSGFTINASYENNGGQYYVNQAVGGPIVPTYDKTNVGRATWNSGNENGYMYLFNSRSSVFLNFEPSSGAFDVGWGEPQTQTTFTDAAIAGTYVLGELPRPVWDSNDNVGEVKLDNQGNVTGGVTNASVGTFTWDQPLNMPYAWDSPARGTMLLGSQGKQLSCAVLTATKFVCTEQTSQSGHILIFGQ
jgi:hypothetical protein